MVTTAYAIVFMEAYVFLISLAMEFYAAWIVRIMVLRVITLVMTLASTLNVFCNIDIVCITTC